MQYHAHPHGGTSVALHSGLAGAIVIEYPDDLLSAIGNVTEHVMLLKDYVPIEREHSDDSFCSERFINAQHQETLTVREGELQLWRFVAMGPNCYYNLSIGLPFYILDRDGYYSRLEPVEDYLQDAIAHASAT